jgi:hypothetical protein
MKKCFSDVDVPSSEHDWYRETLFSHYGSGVIAMREQAVLDDPALEWTLVHGRKISKEASCNQTEDGMHYLEPTMMKMIEEALAVLGEGSAVASTRADKTGAGHHSQTGAGHHPLKRMQKRVLAHAHKGKLERAHEKMRQVERARESAGRRGEEKQKREKKVRAMEKMKRVRARKDEAARAPSAQEAQVRACMHALTLSLTLP